MFRSNRLVSWAIVVGLTVVLAGCGSKSSGDKQKSAKPSENTAQEGPAGQSAGEAADGLAELSAADAAAAKKQRVCPVTGEVLGAMGKPYKVTIQGKTIFLCCSGCEKELRKNPEKYVAKLEKGTADGKKSPATDGK
jgi:YHS domain-containing protein